MIYIKSSLNSSGLNRLNLLLIIICILLTSLILQGKAQEKNLKKLVTAGNSALQKGSTINDNTISGDYSRSQKQEYIKKSIDIWNEVLKITPDDPDANFKLGLSYLRTFDKKTNALPYLIKATKRLKKNYSIDGTDGGAAPFYALYYLGEAYRLNNQPDSALKYYSAYRNRYKVPPIPMEDVIFMALNSRQSINNSRNVTLKSIQAINTEFPEYSPVASVDGNKLFFCSRRPVQSADPTVDSKKVRISEDVYYSQRDESGKFSTAVPFPFNSEYDEVPLFLSSDGKSLYLRLSKKKNADIFVSTFQDNQWTKPVPFKGINSGFNENGITFSLDGKTMYFSSDRAGGTGGFDIYYSKMDEKGKWSIPENLAYPINTSKNEINPCLAPDGTTLYFSSNGIIDLGIGGYDVYFSEKKADGKWKVPINLGNPINKSGDDLGMYAVSEGKRFFSQVVPEMSFDIIEVEGGSSVEEDQPANVEVVTVINEMAVAQVFETEKEVEKEVTVVEAVETQVEVEKEVEVKTEIEVEKIVEVEKEIFVNDETAKSSSKNEENISKNNTPVHPDNESTSSISIQPEVLPVTDKAKAFVPEPIVDKTLTLFYALNHIYPNTRELKAINQFAKTIKETSESVVYQIIGHSDKKGQWDANLRVSTARAKKVYDQLVKHGVPKSRLIFYGLGYSVPLKNGSDSEFTDRRVEVKVLEQ